MSPSRESECFEKASRSSLSKKKVGFHTLPDQLVASQVKKGFSFNVLCIGENGIGKTTLLSNLFQQNLKDHDFNAEELTKEDLLVKKYKFIEGGSELRVTVIETVNYASKMDKTNCIDGVVSYIERKYQNHLNQELHPHRPTNIFDERVHMCLYMISPKSVTIARHDLLALRKLQKLVNVIPIIPRADTFTLRELQAFRRRINDDLALYQIKLYRFPTDDPVSSVANMTANGRIPFAVITSIQFEQKNNHTVEYFRKYAHGTILISPSTEYDTITMRDSVIRTNLYDIIRTTDSIHYQKFRREYLIKNCMSDFENFILHVSPFSTRSLENYEKSEKERVYTACREAYESCLTNIRAEKEQIRQRMSLNTSGTSNGIDSPTKESQTVKPKKKSTLRFFGIRNSQIMV